MGESARVLAALRGLFRGEKWAVYHWPEWGEYERPRALQIVPSGISSRRAMWCAIVSVHHSDDTEAARVAAARTALEALGWGVSVSPYGDRRTTYLNLSLPDAGDP